MSIFFISSLLNYQGVLKSPLFQSRQSSSPAADRFTACDSYRFLRGDCRIRNGDVCIKMGHERSKTGHCIFTILTTNVVRTGYKYRDIGKYWEIFLKPTHRRTKKPAYYRFSRFTGRNGIGLRSDSIARFSKAASQTALLGLG
jgi:hypothetical protein